MSHPNDDLVQTVFERFEVPEWCCRNVWKPDNRANRIYFNVRKKYTKERSWGSIFLDGQDWSIRWKVEPIASLEDALTLVELAEQLELFLKDEMLVDPHNMVNAETLEALVLEHEKRSQRKKKNEFEVLAVSPGGWFPVGVAKKLKSKSGDPYYRVTLHARPLSDESPLIFYVNEDE